MQFDEYNYSVAGHYIPAIINGDETGLSDEESKDLEQFLSAVESSCGKGGHWDCNDQTQFVFDAVSGLPADCFRATYFVPVED